MKFLFTIILSLSTLIGSSYQVTSVVKAEYVYICYSKTAKVYHSTSYCSGLNRCTHEIKKITKQGAIDLGRRSCKICY